MFFSLWLLDKYRKNVGQTKNVVQINLVPENVVEILFEKRFSRRDILVKILFVEIDFGTKICLPNNFCPKKIYPHHFVLYRKTIGKKIFVPPPPPPKKKNR